MLKKYIRDPRTNQPKGVIVGFKTGDNRFVVGYSLCHRSDKFDKASGDKLAIDRANWWGLNNRSFNSQPIPSAVSAEMPKFYDRCNRFFKGCTGPAYLLHLE